MTPTQCRMARAGLKLELRANRERSLLRAEDMNEISFVAD